MAIRYVAPGVEHRAGLRGGFLLIPRPRYPLTEIGPPAERGGPSRGRGVGVSCDQVSKTVEFSTGYPQNAFTATTILHDPTTDPLVEVKNRDSTLIISFTFSSSSFGSQRRSIRNKYRYYVNHIKLYNCRSYMIIKQYQKRNTPPL